MIRAILVVGWLGMVLQAIAAWMGYTTHDAATAQQHVVVSLFPCGALLFADLCLLVYLPGTVRLVRRMAGELGLDDAWRREQARLARVPSLVAVLAVIATGSLFATGYPTYSGYWQPWIHHTLFVATTVLQLVLLLVGGRALRRGEARLQDLGREAAAHGLA